MKLPTTAKTLLLVRHGITEMNVYLGTSGYGTPGFVDPGKWDTRLTADGEAQAKHLYATLRDEKIDLLVSSPLTRALMTADLAFGDDPAAFPRVAQPLIAERRWLSSDVGRPESELASDFGHYDLSALGDGRWWWEGDDAAAAAARAARAKLQGVAPADLRGVARHLIADSVHPTLITGVHLCGTLALRAVQLYNECAVHRRRTALCGRHMTAT